MALAFQLLGSRIREWMVTISPLLQGNRNPGQAVGLPAALPQAHGIALRSSYGRPVVMISGVRMGVSPQVTLSKDSPRAFGCVHPGSPAEM